VDETRGETPSPWRRVHTLTRDVSTNHSQKAIRVTSYCTLLSFFFSCFQMTFISRIVSTRHLNSILHCLLFVAESLLH
jgi:hypothetical protein